MASSGPARAKASAACTAGSRRAEGGGVERLRRSQRLRVSKPVPHRWSFTFPDEHARVDSNRRSSRSAWAGCSTVTNSRRVLFAVGPWRLPVDAAVAFGVIGPSGARPSWRSGDPNRIRTGDLLRDGQASTPLLYGTVRVKAQLPVTIRAPAPCDTMGLVSRANGGIRTRVITLEE